jgi:hypothetical protein
MLKIAAVPSQALTNIVKFEDELRGSPELQGRLAYARAWYAHQDKKGRWRFAPSKFVGYEGIDAKTYLQVAEESDGRRTEAQLQMWFAALDPMSELYEEVSRALFAFLAKYGKAPSTKMRINVLRKRRKLYSGALEEDAHDTLVNLMLAVARTLPKAHLHHLRKQLQDV